MSHPRGQCARCGAAEVARVPHVCPAPEHIVVERNQIEAAIVHHLAARLGVPTNLREYVDREQSRRLLDAVLEAGWSQSRHGESCAHCSGARPAAHAAFSDPVHHGLECPLLPFLSGLAGK